MRSIFFLKVSGLIAIIALSFYGCVEKEQYEPIPQEILFDDTSGVTGELTVFVLYDNGLGSYLKAEASHVFLYASYDDIIRDLEQQAENLAIYRLYTGNSNHACFGFINYGNYYALAYNYLNNNYYEKISIVQVRPMQKEELTITLQNMDI